MKDDDPQDYEQLRQLCIVQLRQISRLRCMLDAVILFAMAEALALVVMAYYFLR